MDNCSSHCLGALVSTSISINYAHTLCYSLVVCLATLVSVSYSYVEYYGSASFASKRLTRSASRRPLITAPATLPLWFISVCSPANPRRPPHSGFDSSAKSSGPRPSPTTLGVVVAPRASGSLCQSVITELVGLEGCALGWKRDARNVCAAAVASSSENLASPSAGVGDR